MGVSADYDIDAPGRVYQLSQFLVLFESDVGQQDGEIYIETVVGIADLFYLRGCVFYSYK